MSDPRDIPMGSRAPIPNWVVDDTTERDAIRYRRAGVQISILDIGCVCRVGTSAPYSYYVLDGVNPLAWSPLGGGSSLSLGSTAGTACEGNDSRLSNARQLAAGADKTKLDALPDAATLTAALATKADATTTTAALATKADATTTTAALATKAGIATERGYASSRTVTSSDTAVLTDRGSLIDVTAAATNAQTIPKNSSVAFGVPQVLTYCFRGAGLATMTPEDGTVTLLPPVGRTLVVSAHESGKCRWVQATQVAANVWALTGDLV